MGGLLLPVQVGYHHGQLSRQDGFISAQVTFLLLISVGITMSIGYILQTKPISENVVNILLIIVMMLCCFVMLFYMTLGSNMVHDKSTSTNTPRTTKDFVRTKIVIIGLMVFYVFAMFVDGFRIMAVLTCILYTEKLIDLFFHVTRWIFMSMIMIFSVIFDKVVFIKCVFNHYAMMLLGAGVVIVWFDSVVYEYNMILEDKESRSYNMTDVNNETCHNKSTNEYILAGNASHFLYTFMTEFALLAFKILIQMFFQMKHETDVGVPHLAETDDNGLQGCIQESEPLQNNNLDEDIVVANNISSENDQLLSQPEVENNNERRHFCYWRNMPCILVLLIPMNLIFVIVCVMSYSNSNINFYFIVEIINWIPMILCSIVGFYSAKCLVSNFSPFSGLEIMVVACSLGIFAYDLFSIYSVVYRLSEHKNSTASSSNQNTTLMQLEATTTKHLVCDSQSTTLVYLTLCEKILNIIEAYFQASFILFARRVKYEQSHDQQRNIRYRIFWECVLYLAVANLLMWGNDSYVKVKHPAVEPVMDCYYGDNAWSLIVHLTFPFALFFRFNSFLLLLYTLLMD